MHTQADDMRGSLLFLLNPVKPFVELTRMLLSVRRACFPGEPSIVSEDSQSTRGHTERMVHIHSSHVTVRRVEV